MPRIATWMGNSSFTYSGCPLTGTAIRYGKDGKTSVASSEYAALGKHFKGRAVPVGASRTSPAPGSLGAWLKQSGRQTAIATYVASILVHTGHAKRVKDNIVVI